MDIGLFLYIWAVFCVFFVFDFEFVFFFFKERGLLYSR